MSNDRLFNIYNASSDLKKNVRDFKKMGYSIRLHVTIIGCDDAHYLDVSLAAMAKLLDDSTGDLMICVVACSYEDGRRSATFTVEASDYRLSRAAGPRKPAPKDSDVQPVSSR